LRTIDFLSTHRDSDARLDTMLAKVGGAEVVRDKPNLAGARIGFVPEVQPPTKMAALDVRPSGSGNFGVFVVLVGATDDVGEDGVQGLELAQVHPKFVHDRRRDGQRATS